jgi:hypothetical protein
MVKKTVGKRRVRDNCAVPTRDAKSPTTASVGAPGARKPQGTVLRAQSIVRSNTGQGGTIGDGEVRTDVNEYVHEDWGLVGW